MLNKGERKQVLGFFKIWSILGLLPIEINVANWELKGASGKWKWICTLGGMILGLEGLYKNVSLAHAYLFHPDVQLHQMVIHAVLAMASVMLPFWYYVAYIRDPLLFASFVKMTLVGNVGGSLDVGDAVEKSWTARLKEYSLQDLIAAHMPYMVFLAVPVITASFIYDPTMRLLLYAALPSRLQTWTTFGLCLLQDVHLLVTLAAIATPIWQLQVISFDLVCNQLQNFIRTTQMRRSGSLSVWKVTMKLRMLQLYVSMVNNVNSYLIFTWKLLSISACIICGYAALAHFSEHPIFGVMYYVILLDVTFIYTVIYEKAFKVPQMFQEATASALLRMRGNQLGVLRRQIRSIPRTGIKVGHFHTMERESTLIFVDFVVRNIVGMLVAYG